MIKPFDVCTLGYSTWFSLCQFVSPLASSTRDRTLEEENATLTIYNNDLSCCSYVIALKERDSVGNFVVFSVYFDPDPSNFDLSLGVRAGSAILDSWLLENGSVAGQTVIYDQEYLSIKHITKISFSFLRNLVHFNKVSYSITSTIYI